MGRDEWLDAFVLEEHSAEELFEAIAAYWIAVKLEQLDEHPEADDDV